DGATRQDRRDRDQPGAALSALRLAQSPAHVRTIEALVLFVDRDRWRVFEAVNLVENRLPRRVDVARIRDNPVLTIERTGALVPAPVGTVFHRRVSLSPGGACRGVCGHCSRPRPPAPEAPCGACWRKAARSSFGR